MPTWSSLRRNASGLLPRLTCNYKLTRPPPSNSPRGGSWTHNIIPSRHAETSVQSDGNVGSVGQDELDTVQSLAQSPVLHCKLPAVACITKSMDKNDCGRMPSDCRD